MTERAYTVAVIPARGGSKRIPNKNIRPFAGRPMISYSIRAAQDSGLFDRILVSTDSGDIAATAKEYGAEIPFNRPGGLSDDYTATSPVVTHALQWLKDNGTPANYACSIYATAPFVRAQDIARGLEILKDSDAATAFTVTSFPFPVFRALEVKKDGTLAMFWPEHRLTRSQDLPDAYHDAGQFYWLNAERFLKKPDLYGADSRPILLPRYLVQDIDTLEDWETAERMYRALMFKEP